jgi:hypothetical protein
VLVTWIGELLKLMSKLELEGGSWSVQMQCTYKGCFLHPACSKWHFISSRTNEKKHLEIHFNLIFLSSQFELF